MNSSSLISLASLNPGNNFDNLNEGFPADNRRQRKEIIRYIEYVYITAMIFWVLLIVVLQLYETDVIGLLILLVPFASFAFGYFNSYYINEQVEEYVFQNNYFSVGLLITLPLLTWINREYSNPERRKKFTSILVMAIILIMFSILDIWVPLEILSVIKHLHSVLQTTALILLIYALYMFYIECPSGILC